MDQDDPLSTSPAAPEVEGAAPGKALTPAARRALQEAAARRLVADQIHGLGKSPVSAHPDGETPEDGGPAGLEPTRYGDWERNGLAVDF